MKKSILIDIDDCICDNVYFKILKDVIKSNKKIEDCTEYHVEDNFNLSKEQIDCYNNRLGQINPYKRAIIHKDCIEVIQKLNEKYNVYICSAAILKENLLKSGNYFKYKYDFLRQNFPFLNPFNFIFACNKTMLKADIMIDDKPANLRGNNVKEKLLFTAYHNKNLTDKELRKQGLKRVNDWKEIKNILL